MKDELPFHVRKFSIKKYFISQQSQSHHKKRLKAILPSMYQSKSTGTTPLNNNQTIIKMKISVKLVNSFFTFNDWSIISLFILLLLHFISFYLTNKIQFENFFIIWIASSTWVNLPPIEIHLMNLYCWDVVWWTFQMATLWIQREVLAHLILMRAMPARHRKISI